LFLFPFFGFGDESFASKNNGASGILFFIENLFEQLRLTTCLNIKKQFLGGRKKDRTFARAIFFALR
jgi:hypothetical protein